MAGSARRKDVERSRSRRATPSPTTRSTARSRAAAPASRRSAEGDRPRHVHARRQPPRHALRPRPSLAARARRHRLDRHLEARRDGCRLGEAGQEEGPLSRRGRPRPRGRDAADRRRRAPRGVGEVRREAAHGEARRRDARPARRSSSRSPSRNAARRETLPSAGGAVPQHGNVRGPKKSGKGDVVKGFAEAEATLELTVTTSVQTHVAMETHSLFAEWEGDSLKVYASTQGTFTVKDELARCSASRRTRSRSSPSTWAAASAPSSEPGDYGVFAAQLAKKAGKPVKLILDRKEEHLAAGNRPDSINTIKLGYRKDGTVTAVQYTSVGTAGVATGTGTGSFVKNAYGFPNVQGRGVRRLHASRARLRDARARPPAGRASRSKAALDAVAEACGLDPLAVRLKNDPSDVRRAEWEAAAKAIGWSRRDAITQANKAAAAGPAAPARPRLRGGGLVQHRHQGLAGPGPRPPRRHGRGRERRSGDRRRDPHGDRASSTAEELGLPVEPSTWDRATPGTRSGPPPAARRRRPRSFRPSAPRPITPPASWRRSRRLSSARRSEDVKLGGGRLSRERETGRLGEGLRADERRVHSRHGRPRARLRRDRSAPLRRAIRRRRRRRRDGASSESRRSPPRTTCGLSVWKTGVESQIRGGVLQGVSYALFEERVVDLPTGRFLNPNHRAVQDPRREGRPRGRHDRARPLRRQEQRARARYRRARHRPTAGGHRERGLARARRAASPTCRSRRRVRRRAHDRGRSCREARAREVTS